MYRRIFSGILAALFFAVISIPAAATTVTDQGGVDLLTSMYRQVTKTCPEELDQAKTKEQEFGDCSQKAFTACVQSTKPKNPLVCGAPATKQCRSIIDEFLKTCSAVSPTPETNPSVVEYHVSKMTIKRIAGDVRVQPAGQAEQPAAKKMELKEGDEIFAGYASQVVLETDKGDIIVVKPNTQIRIVGKVERKFELKLDFGEVRAKVTIVGPARPDIRIQTPTVTASVRGTEFLVRAAKNGASVVLVAKGTVAVTNNQTGKEMLVSAGQKISGTAVELGDPKPLTTEDQNAFRDDGIASPKRVYAYAAFGVAAFVIVFLLIVRRRRNKER